jgi:hypothetical protein
MMQHHIPQKQSLPYLEIYRNMRVKYAICRIWGRREVCTGSWWGNLRERRHWGDPDVNGRIILRWIFRKLEGVWGLDGVDSG